MPIELRLVGAFALAAALTFALTPVAIATATSRGFLDHPAAHKGHMAATPYLGGVAVVAATLWASAVFGTAIERWAPVALGAVVLCVVGIVDDRRTVLPGYRVLIEVAVACGLWATDMGWTLFNAPGLNLALTIVWVVALVNAFNLFDNMDGAVGALAAVCGAGIVAGSLLESDTSSAIMAAALSGAAVAFLRFNLARPSRIFLGDGGSLPIGLIAATLVMAAPAGHHMTWSHALMSVLLVGVPILETTLVVTSRLRRGVSPFTPGRDHLSHRLLARYPSPRRIAAGLAAVQAGLSVLALAAGEIGVGAVLAVTALYGALVWIVIAYFETPAWAPQRARSSP